MSDRCRAHGVALEQGECPIACPGMPAWRCPTCRVRVRPGFHCPDHLTAEPQTPLTKAEETRQTEIADQAARVRIEAMLTSAEAKG